jgi:ATP-dependent Clp protease adaptor protein ClpS
MANRVRGLIVAQKHLKALLHHNEKPNLYKVIVINDDYTPMGFVIEVLEQFFMMSPERAMRIMLGIHNQGKAVCGKYTKDIAEAKVNQVNEFSHRHEHPLLCVMEEMGEGE